MCNQKSYDRQTDRQHNGQQKQDKMTNNDVQIIATSLNNTNPHKTGSERMCSGQVGSSCCTSDIRLGTINGTILYGKCVVQNMFLRYVHD